MTRSADDAAPSRGSLRLRRKILVGQRLYQLRPVPLVLLAEGGLLYLAVVGRIGLVEWGLGHATVCLLLLFWCRRTAQRIRRSQLAWLLCVFTAATGLAGPAVALFAAGFLSVYHRDTFDFQAWYDSLFPVDTASHVTQLYETLLRRRAQSGANAVESFSDIMAAGNSARKRLAIGLLMRHFRPVFAPALRVALTDSDPSVRTQAATAVATIEGRFLENAQRLAREAEARPDSFARRFALARHYDDYAFTGLLDSDRERDNRLQALESYNAAMAIDPNEPGVWLAIGRLKVRERSYAEAIAWFEAAETKRLMTADMALWQIDALFRSGRYADLRRAIAHHRPLFEDKARQPPQVPGILNLWAPTAS
jgi:hypothetical protein